MAPTSHPKGTNGAEAHKPTALAPITKHALKKSIHPQRSSLRKAVRESLLDLSAIATITTPLPSSQALFLPSPSSSTSTSASRINATTQRSSLRRALKESLRDVAAIRTVATITATSSSTLPTPPITPGFVSVKSSSPSSPYPPVNTPEISSIHSSASPPNYITARSSPDSASAPTLGYKESDDSRRAESDSGHERSEHQEVAGKTNINGIPTSRKGWYRVRSIITEGHDRNGHLIYFVDWEGHDPRTGVSWPGSWVDSKNVSEAAIHEWQGKRTK
ncbi:hypothetical protein F4814DRAFT_448575 [Daldinia grandis]|nr:hypothetical protein F4814DRAFT_448575 [Daldinia grandis]